MVGDKRKFNVVLITLKAVGATGERPGGWGGGDGGGGGGGGGGVHKPTLTRSSGGNDLEKAASMLCSPGVTTISQAIDKNPQPPTPSLLFHPLQAP